MRRPRDTQTSDRFHVYNRGADRQDIFSLSGDKALFLELLAIGLERHNAVLEAYALMTNHYHLVIHTEDGNLADIMHLVAARYASAYNQRTDRTGPVFDSRFKSVPIVGEHHLAGSVRYIHRNPLAFVPPRSLAAYDASSLAVYLGRQSPPQWLDTSVVETLIDRTTYLDDVLAVRDNDLIRCNGFDAIRRLSLDDIDLEVRQITGADPHTTPGQARLLAITIATEVRACDVIRLATHYDLSPGAIRQQARRGRVRVLQDHYFATLKQRVVDALRAA